MCLGALEELVVLVNIHKQVNEVRNKSKTLCNTLNCVKFHLSLIDYHNMHVQCIINQNMMHLQVKCTSLMTI